MDDFVGRILDGDPDPRKSETPEEIENRYYKIDGRCNKKAREATGVEPFKRFAPDDLDMIIDSRIRHNFRGTPEDIRRRRERAEAEAGGPQQQLQQPGQGQNLKGNAQTDEGNQNTFKSVLGQTGKQFMEYMNLKPPSNDGGRARPYVKPNAAAGGHFFRLPAGGR